MKLNHKSGLLILASLSLAATSIEAAPRFANSPGTLSGTLILQKALQFCFSQRPELKMVSMGFKELDGRVENALLNQSVTSRLIGTSTVNDFGTGPVDTADTDVTIALTAKKEIHVAFTLAEVNSTDRDLINERAMSEAVALGDHILGSVASKVVAANFTRSITVASAWDYDNTLRAVKKNLDNNKVPVNNRFLIVNSDVNDSLLADSMVVTALNNPQNQNAIATGKLPATLGLQIAQFNQLPNNGENLVAFAGTADALTYVARAPKSPQEIFGNGVPVPGLIDYITDPATGFRVMVNQWIDMDTLTVNSRLVWFQGYGVGNPANLVRIKTA